MLTRCFFLASLAFILPAQLVYSQSDCRSILQLAESAFQKNKLDDALQKLQDAETCDYKAELVKERQALQSKIFKAVEKLRHKAEDNLLLAQQKTLEAEQNQRLAIDNALLAEAEEERAKLLLYQMKKANAQVADLILEDANRSILALDYKAALRQVKAAGRLEVEEENVSPYYLELAFWYHEAGNTALAISLADSVANLRFIPAVSPTLSSSAAVDTIVGRNEFRAALQKLDSARFDFLMKRYYPEIVKVEGGSFEMGAKWNGDNVHTAIVSDFQMAKYETTWWQYFLFCESSGHPFESPGWGAVGNNPVVKVTWENAVGYCNWLSRQLDRNQGIEISKTIFQMPENRNTRKPSSKTVMDYTVHLRSGFRLPTEAEWEYAAKEGKHHSSLEYSGGSLYEVGWYAMNSNNRTHPVGLKKPNKLGLHDMSGNVAEWCWDFYDDYPSNPLPDYTGPKGASRICRGGAWDGKSHHSCLVDLRIMDMDNQTDLDGQNDKIGFRVACGF